MKPLLVAVLGMVAFASRASADLIVYDPFNYGTTAPGNVLGLTNTNNAWTSVGNGTVEPRVVSANLSFSSAPTSGGSAAQLDNNNFAATGADASRLSLSVGSASTVYYSFVLSIPLAGYTQTPASSTSYFAGFDSNPLTSTTAFANAGSLYVKNIGGNVALGISNGNAAAGKFTTDTFNGQTVFVIASYTIGGGATLSIFNNGQDPLTDTPIDTLSTSTASSTIGTISSFFLRGNVSNPQGIQVDDLRVATTWDEAVPEPGSAALLVGMGCSSLLNRRRR